MTVPRSKSRLALSSLPGNFGEAEERGEGVREAAGEELVGAEEDESDEASDEDEDEDGEFGYPLRRMVSFERTAHTTLTGYDPDHEGPGETFGPVIPVEGGFYMISSSRSSSSQVHFVNFEKVVDEYMEKYGEEDPGKMISVEPHTDNSRNSASAAPASLMLKRVPLQSPELALLRQLDAPDVRLDPWNPAPRLLYATSRGEETVLCFERLWAYDQPPMRTVANVVDYVRQAVEGLSFLHEYGIAHGAYAEPDGVMLDLGRPSAEGFDRTTYPVRYYRVDFARAVQLPTDPLMDKIAEKRTMEAFMKDVRDCGRMLAPLVDEVPQVGGKLRALAYAMTGGEYGAEDARKLWEALCRGIDAETYTTGLGLPPSSRSSSASFSDDEEG